jgi:hypothetical protein
LLIWLFYTGLLTFFLVVKLALACCTALLVILLIVMLLPLRIKLDANCTEAGDCQVQLHGGWLIGLLHFSLNWTPNTEPDTHLTLCGFELLEEK